MTVGAALINAFILVPFTPSLNVPATWSFVVGEFVAIPTDQLLVIRMTSVGATLVVPLRLANTISPCVFPVTDVVRNQISAGAYRVVPARPLYPNPMVWSAVIRFSSHPILRYGTPYATERLASAHCTHLLIII